MEAKEVYCKESIFTPTLGCTLLLSNAVVVPPSAIVNHVRH